MLDDGLLDVVVIGPMTKRKRCGPPTAVHRHHSQIPAYEHHLAREVTVAAPGIVAYADGERSAPPLTVECAPERSASVP